MSMVLTGNSSYHGELFVVHRLIRRGPMIAIREAKSEDAKSICLAEKIIAETPGFLVSPPHELLEASFRQKIETLSGLVNGTYIVAESDGRMVGHAMLDPMGLEAIQHVSRLTIAVHSGFEGKGIGEAILKHLIAWAQSAPTIEKIELNVRASNLRAIRLYQKCGFKFESRIRNRVKGPGGRYLDDLEMGLFVKEEPSAVTTVSHSVGTVVSARKEAVDDGWDAVASHVRLDSAQFGPEALAGLEDFSHVEIIFQMDQVDVRKIETSARHPRNNTDWPKVGIFAQRGKNRPNQIGTTVCRIVKVDGLNLYLEGLDAIDGSPVLDIKPWVQEFGPRGSVRQPNWMTELMRGYWK
jgi:tRNA (adenine37-N6)-methyltransferase